MAGNLFHRFLVLIVHLVHTLCLLILGNACQLTFLCRDIPDIDTIIGLIRDHLGYDILRTLDGIRHSGHRPGSILILMNIFRRFFLDGRGRLLRQNKLRQAVQPLLLRHAGSCLTLRAVRPVKILHYHHGFRRYDLRLQLLGQFPLFLYTL